MTDMDDRVVVRLTEIRERLWHGDPHSAHALIHGARDTNCLLAVAEIALEIHRPIRRYWCQECQTSYPCRTRREVTAALLGETVDD